MGSPDRVSEDQLSLDRSRRALWYGIVCGERTGDGRLDFLVRAGGFTEAEKLIGNFPLENEILPKGRTIYFPNGETSSKFDALFGEERLAIRVVSTINSLVNPSNILVVEPCNSKKWIEDGQQTPPWWWSEG